MSETRTTSDTSPSAAVHSSRAPKAFFDVALCGQCNTCQRYFPCEQLSVLQIQNHDTYQDTGRLICFECQRDINLRAYQARELSRQEVESAVRHWLIQRHFLPEGSPDV
jgi:TPP-dependent indolepyruvate ferredoxin oxidoreductase alpha subunit